MCIHMYTVMYDVRIYVCMLVCVYVWISVRGNALKMGQARESPVMYAFLYQSKDRPGSAHPHLNFIIYDILIK